MSNVENIKEFANQAKPAHHGPYQWRSKYSVTENAHLRLVVIVALAAFCCEFLLMTIAVTLPLADWLLVILDASLLTVLLFPVLYFFMFQPLLRNIQERKRSETVLRESEMRFRTVFDTSPDSIIISRLQDGLIINVNDGFCDLTGYSPKEVLGKSTVELELWKELQERERLVDMLQKHGSVNNFEASFKLKDDCIINGLISARTITLNSEPHILSVIRDITEWKITQKRLHASHGFLDIANRHNKTKPLVEEFIAQIKELTHCTATGIRILDENGNTTCQTFDNFNPELYIVETPHFLDSIRSLCSEVIPGKTGAPGLLLTAGGSFYAAHTSHLLATLSEAEKNQIRDVCGGCEYESVALIPIPLGTKVLGHIHLADPRQHMLSNETIMILEGASLQLGTAIGRIRVEEALEKSHRELERRVEKRTALLTSANERLNLEIEEGKLKEEKLRSLSSKLVLTEERERRHIANEIHDRIGQSLAITKIKLGELQEALTTPAAAHTLVQVRGFIEQTIQDTRSLTFELSPPVLYELGLEPALSWLAAETREKTGLSILLKCDELAKPLDNDCRVIAFQATRELLFNVVKHARAKIATISVKRDGKVVHIDVEDDGIGFDTSKLEATVSGAMGFGLFSIRERLQPLGGRLEIHSEPGSGTQVALVVPLVCTRKVKEG